MKGRISRSYFQGLFFYQWICTECIWSNIRISRLVDMQMIQSKNEKAIKYLQGKRCWIRFPQHATKNWMMQWVVRLRRYYIDALLNNWKRREKKEKSRGHPGSNQEPLDLQSNALPLSYIPCTLLSTLVSKSSSVMKDHQNSCYNVVLMGKHSSTIHLTRIALTCFFSFLWLLSRIFVTERLSSVLQWEEMWFPFFDRTSANTFLHL